ncbi:SprT family protein [[Haemophilus] felis]|uniref:Protein SprT n=1 Tax=[Haemophilus] felis TaxID=123822 RepID=A0A1T0AXV0_9PAST|nr:SprT family protein [[Haemophilus] felis]
MMSVETQFRHLKMQVQWRLTHCLNLVQQHFQRTFSPPQVSYELRGQKAGVAYLQQNLIKLNRTLLLENPQDFIQQVVPHELAHLIVFQQFGRVKPHGKEWQSVMKNIFHLPAEIYHCFGLATVNPSHIPYQCACQTHYLSPRRHQKVVKHRVVYLCKQCGAEITKI